MALSAVNAAPDFDSVDFNNPMVRRILAAAIKGLNSQAAHKLSMLDIADLAGVSRATLYRYFSTKTDIIKAANEFTSTTFEETVKRVAAPDDAPLKVLGAVLDYHFNSANAENYSRILEIEPSLVIQFFTDHFERHKAAIGVALEPTFLHLEKTLGMNVDRDLISELLVRMEISTLLVPAGPRWNLLPKLAPQLVAELEALAKAAKANKG